MNRNFQQLGRQLQAYLAVSHPADGNLEPVYRRVTEFLTQAQQKGELAEVAEQIVAYVGADRLLPACYARFQPMVTESLAFVLQQLPPDCLARKIVDQLRLDPKTPPGRRICCLIQDMPTLQKLGQIICRTPGLDPAFKEALVALEDDVGSVTFAEMRPLIEAELARMGTDPGIIPEKRIMAEASVCAVVGARVRGNGKSSGRTAVLKLLKPDVRRNLMRELLLFDDLARFLDHRKSQWGLGGFKFQHTLDQVRWLLENEVDLEQEQANLDLAERYFRKHDHLAVPRRLSGSTPAMTVMACLKGRKITDIADLTAPQRRLLARILTETCILRPIKDLGDQTVFHGDPHGGNIAYRFEGGQPQIIFYDWGMLGQLSRLERFAFALMGLGVMAQSTLLVLFAADIATGGQLILGKGWVPALYDTVDEMLSRRKTRTGGVITDIGALLGELACRGVVFPTNLLMFQKSLVTLKGVIHDIDPVFEFDSQWIQLALASYADDLIRPGYYYDLFKEIWHLGRYSLGRVLSVQRILFRILGRMGAAGLKLPWEILESAGYRPAPARVEVAAKQAGYQNHRRLR